eukprot:CAMPEP_0197427506 /NCGR_PEP_ID=MMETSP1170-20131217/38498_1 /TAXON_ID=54406 /ORGANISM="Sarcinochrysis sp, Strain CCMP770" /LENGTH=101 /DNA_ID=CAMNT_0042955201 /DNA_START=375 /DNA_END=677 /DNA_ORIENTATION=+
MACRRPGPTRHRILIRRRIFARVALEARWQKNILPGLFRVAVLDGVFEAGVEVNPEMLLVAVDEEETGDLNLRICVQDVLAEQPPRPGDRRERVGMPQKSV